MKASLKTSAGTPRAEATNITGRPRSRGSVSCPPATIALILESVSVAKDVVTEFANVSDNNAPSANDVLSFSGFKIVRRLIVVPSILV